METFRLLRIADLFKERSLNNPTFNLTSNKPDRILLDYRLLERCEGDRPLNYRDKYDLRSNFC